jgi:hypothetical protein
VATKKGDLIQFNVSCGPAHKNLLLCTLFLLVVDQYGDDKNVSGVRRSPSNLLDHSLSTWNESRYCCRLFSLFLKRSPCYVLDIELSQGNYYVINGELVLQHFVMHAEMY